MTIEFKKYFNESFQKNGCAICLQSLAEGDLLGHEIKNDKEKSNTKKKIHRIWHVFHEKCLEQWIGTGSKKCPVCIKEFNFKSEDSLAKRMKKLSPIDFVREDYLKIIQERPLLPDWVELGKSVLVISIFVEEVFSCMQDKESLTWISPFAGLIGTVNAVEKIASFGIRIIKEKKTLQRLQDQPELGDYVNNHRDSLILSKRLLKNSLAAYTIGVAAAVFKGFKPKIGLLAGGMLIDALRGCKLINRSH